jgi:MFS superfamily sulfate permease-like transporter
MATPGGLPVPALPAWQPHDLRQLLLPAFSMLIVAFSDDVLTARSFARRGEQVRANQELLALGGANAASGLLRGFPVSTSATRTALGLPHQWLPSCCSSAQCLDFTGLEAVDAVREELAAAGTVFALARVKRDLLARLESFGLADKIGPDRLYPPLPTAVAAYEAWASQHPPGQQPDGAGEAG